MRRAGSGVPSGCQQNCQTVNPQIQKLSALNTLNHKTPHSLLKMSTVSPETSRETTTPLTDGCKNN